MRIKAKLILALSAILVTAFSATSFVNYNIAREAVREELLNSSLPLTSKNIYSEIHTAIMRPILVSSSMATDTFLKGWIRDGEKDLPGIENYLAEIKRHYGFLTAFFVSADTDRYYYPGGVLKKISPREPRDIWYYAFTRSRKKHALNVDLSMQDQDAMTIFVNYRMEDDTGKLLGAVGVGINMDKAVTLLKQTRERYGRNVYLVDQDGLIQVHPEIKPMERRYITEEDGIRDIADTLLQPRTETAKFEYDRDDRHYLLAVRYMPELEWFLIVEQDEGKALTAARHNLIRTLAVGLGASLLILFLCVLTINHFQKRLERMAKTDPLTGAANRRALEERFNLSAYRASRYGNTFSVIVIDLDDFKEINDRHGHLVGDSILKHLVETIGQTIRPDDMLSRWGGDEFIILLDGNAENAEDMADRIRTTVTKASDRVPVSFSYGISQYRKGDSLNDMTLRADRAMYGAKAQRSGCVASD